MKKLLFLMLIVKNAYASICEENITNQFEFHYSIQNDKLNFNFKKKDKQPLVIYDFYHSPAFTISYSFSDGTKLNPTNAKTPIWGFTKEQVEIDKEISYFFSEENTLISYFYNPLTMSQIYRYPLRNEPKKFDSEYQGQINLREFIDHSKQIIPDDKKYKDNEIYFTFKFIHDSYIKKCSTFRTKSFIYKFGNKWDYVKDKVKEIYN
jgi:hypothetical protein